MNKTEDVIAGYSSKKLKEIIEEQSASYNESFIDYVKDELIRRGESFTFNSKLENEISLMNDEDLKDLVELEWQNFHLEYVEIARKEYLKRGFKNQTNPSEAPLEKDARSRYPALEAIINLYVALAWICGIVLGAFAVYELISKDGSVKYSLFALVMAILILVGLLGTAESIKVFIDIEKNTRRKLEN